MKDNILIWHWQPLVSIGYIHFGEAATPIVTKYNLQKLEPDCKSGDWDTYEFPECETRIYVENCYIVGVGCYDNLFYQGQNLFGLSLDDIRQILGQEDEIGEMIGTQIPIEYFRLGVQLWMKDDAIVGAICNGLIEDE
ncbi:MULTISPECIES: hypothetical protein [Kamptonema]|uniref:hypothetical protein n=1 Tax=Kamptonema TaxID=1501433 RepID=UPI0001DACDF4|nr:MULTISPECIES: hypothetical protein [Kamptonema]CBN57583.1 hypothetical protein OSCI_3470011 [Kamptonema sp. PCC 6506]